MKVIILAGGKGMRLWPLSREGLPKQFLKIGGDLSLFQQTLKRISLIAKNEDIFISIGKDNYLNLKRELRGSGVSEKNIVFRPQNQETAAAVLSCLKKFETDPKINNKEIIMVFPSDHIISPPEKFIQSINKAAEAASLGFIATLGIKPNLPETCYGYLKIGKEEKGFYKVDQFAEKPNRETAEIYLKNGNYFWNSGIFVFPLDLMMAEFKKYSPEIFSCINNEKENCPLPLDKAVMEKSQKIVTVPATFNWVDVGSWRVFYNTSVKNKEDNIVTGDVLTRNVTGSLVVADKKLIVGVNLKDIVVIDSGDAIFVAPRDNADTVKEILEEMKTNNRSELKIENPCVSISTIISTQEDFDNLINTTIKNVLTQQYPSIEYIVLNKGLPEWNKKIEEEVKKYKDKDKNKTAYVISKSNGKNYESMNDCLRETTGEIIGFLNPNNLFSDEFAIQSIVSTIKENKADACWGDLVYVKASDTDKIIRFYQSSNYGKKGFYSGWHPPFNTFFVRRGIYDKYGYFRTDLPIAADYELMLRFLEKYKIKSCYIPRIMVKVKNKGLGNFLDIQKVIMSNIECYKSFKLNGLKVNPIVIFLKPLLKVPQFLRKK